MAAHVRRHFFMRAIFTHTACFGKWIEACIILFCMFDAIGAARMVCILLVFWLGARSMVISFVPTWGVFVPHAHLTTNAMTEADWQNHAREHRLGITAHNRSGATCGGSTKSSNHVFASLPDDDEIVSSVSALIVVLTAQTLQIPVCNVPSARVSAHIFSTRDRFDPPIEPPPNFLVMTIA